MNHNLLINPATGLPILMIDASAIKESGCMRRLVFTAVQGLRVGEDKPNVAIEFGNAFHKFAADFHSAKPESVAIANAVNYHKSLGFEFGPREYRTTEKLFQTCLGYAFEYKFDNLEILRRADTNEYLVEQKFAIEYPGFEKLGFHVLLVGTIDTIGTLNGNELVIVDHKTTSVWDIQGYLESYIASPQLKFYKLVLRKYAELYPATFGRFKDAGAMINGVFLTKAGEAKFARSEVFNYTDDMMAEFELMLHQTIEELCLTILKSSRFAAPWGKLRNLCNSAYGHCPFFAGCNLPSEDALQDWIESRCTTKTYDPRLFGGV